MASAKGIVRYFHPIEYGKFPVSVLIRLVQIALQNNVLYKSTPFYNRKETIILILEILAAFVLFICFFCSHALNTRGYAL